jgi:hypothetical protein
METEPGQRLVMMARPSFLMNSPEWFDDPKNAVDVHVRREDLVKQAMENIPIRLRCFERDLNSYGCRYIHSKPALEDYLKPHPEWETPLRERQNRVGSLLKHLREKEKRIWVGLAEDVPTIEMNMKSSIRLFTRGARPPGLGEPDFGAHYVAYEPEFPDELSLAVLQFFVFFEEQWLRLEASNRTSTQVANWLEARLRESRRAGAATSDRR